MSAVLRCAAAAAAVFLSLPALSGADEITSARYPDADTVLVDALYDAAYRPDGTCRTRTVRTTKILTEKGRRGEGVVRLDFNRRYGTGRIVSVTVTGADGSTREIDVAKTTKDTTDNGGMSANIVDPQDRKLVCAVPGLKVGNTVTVTTEEQTHASRIRDQWADLNVLEDAEPIVRSRIRITEPPERPLKRIVLRAPLGNVSVETNRLADGSLVRTWTATNSPQAFPEPDMPPLFTQVQRLVVSTAADWREISRWYWEISLPHLEKTTEGMTNAVAAIVKAAGPDRDARLRAVYRWVAQEIRYMGLTLEDTSPGYAPHDVSVTFENRYGVCRDKAALLVAMLRLAGFDAYPVLIQVGAKMDPDVPMPYFNHAVVAVAEKGGTYVLLDPTDESSRDLMPAYLCNRSYLVARPDGETLLTSPVVPAERNTFSVTATGTLGADGSAVLEQSLAFGGINDNVFRGALLRRRTEERRKLFESILRTRTPGAELLSFRVEPEDLRDTETPLAVRLVSRIPEVRLRGERIDEIAAPLLTPGFGMVNWMLSGATSLEERKYPLVLSTAAAVEETLRLDLGAGAGEPRNLPPDSRIDGPYAYARTFGATNGSLFVSRRLAVNAVEFDPQAYRVLRERIKDVEAAERRPAVFARDRLANANVHFLENRTEVDILGPRSWVVTNAVVKKILTYDGKKRSSEVKIPFNPATRSVRILSAEVRRLSGETASLKPHETNVMDEGWAASAPRYPAGKILVANLPAVEIGATVTLVTETCVTNAAAPYYARFTFDGYDPIDVRTVRVGGETRTVRRPETLLAEPMTPDDLFWRRTWCVSSNGFAEVLADLRLAADVAPIALPESFADGATGLEAVRAIRDWMAKYVRLAGPALYDVPIPLQLTDPAVVLAERYATRLDYVRTLAALLRGAGFEADVVFAADDADDPEEIVRRDLFERPNVRRFAHALCRVRVREGGFLGFGGTERVLFVGTENEYAPLGATGYDGAHCLDPETGAFARVAAADESLKTRDREKDVITVRENGAVDIDVELLRWGTPVGAFRKLYAEMLPEIRGRHFQKMLGNIAQAASATRELETDVDAYPARLAFSCYVPDFATREGEALTFEIPDFTEQLYPLGNDVRRRPVGVGATEPSETEIEVVLPEGFGRVEHLPASFEIVNPRSPDETWLTHRVTTSERDGRLVVRVVRTTYRHRDTVLDASAAAYLRDRTREAASRANRTIVVRRGKPKGEMVGLAGIGPATPTLKVSCSTN